MSNVEMILDGITDYLNEDTHYAILLTGKWGSGKTRFITETLKPHLEKCNPPKSIIRISACGISTGRELFEKLAEAAINNYVGINEKSPDATDFLKNAGLSSLWNLAEGALSKVGIRYDAPPDLMASLLCKSDNLIVVDDFERRERDSDHSLFGAIGDLTEGQSRKVLLVCAEDENPINVNLSEKYIFGNYRFEPSQEDLLDDILGEIIGGFHCDISARERMLRLMEQYRFCNARSLIRAKNSSTKSLNRRFLALRLCR